MYNNAPPLDDHGVYTVPRQSKRAHETGRPCADDKNVCVLGLAIKRDLHGRGREESCKVESCAGKVKYLGAATVDEPDYEAPVMCITV